VWAAPVPAGANGDGKVPVYSWSEFFALAERTPADVVARRSASVRPGHCANLIYTSGTTGNPKAVMLSHDNYIFNTYAAITSIFGTKGLPEDFRMVSYLPLSHVAAQILDIMFPIVLSAGGIAVGDRNLAALSACTWFARPDALKGSLKGTLVACRPTFFLGVPRVWEKFREAMMAIGAQTKGLKKKIATWAKRKGLEASVNRQLGGSGAKPSCHGLAKKLVLKKVAAALGLDQCLACITGSAPMPRIVMEYFGALDIDIFDVYGMSESAGVTSVNTPHVHQWGTVGPPLASHEVRIEHVTSRGDKPGEGEICYRGRHIMMGYMKDERKTAEAIDKEGWLHSGDVGAFTPQGLLKITGRLKELIITAGGENIAPVPIEDKLKELCPAISNAMMVGDQRKYNVVLLTVKTVLDPETGLSTGELTLQASEVDESVTTSEQVVAQCAQKSSTWYAYLEGGVKEYNSRFAVSNAQKIQKFAVVAGDFSERGGELTATLKLKRGPTTEKHKAVIDAMYA
jgi:long-chain-fatty-acid--CoA ligase ACSBG